MEASTDFVSDCANVVKQVKEALVDDDGVDDHSKVVVAQYHTVTRFPWEEGNGEGRAKDRKHLIRGISWQKAHREMSEEALAALPLEQGECY